MDVPFIEAAAIAVAMSAGAAMVYSTRTLDAFDAAQAEGHSGQSWTRQPQ